MQSFEKIRTEGYLYIDKTGYIPKLLDNEYFFMSRPRRFGKSLLLSTLEAYFKGRKDLFEGLEVAKYETEWVEYPVVHVDFASMNVDNPQNLESRLVLQLMDIAESYGLDIPAERRHPDLAFQYLVRRLRETTGRKVVILIDEYDKGIIDVLYDEKLTEGAKRVLRPFFSVLKSHDQYIRFAMITGVSRFRNTTIFSGFNNPYDLSMDPDYAAICGITHKELTEHFGEGIEKIAGRYGYSKEDTLEVMTQKYDGYRFTLDKTRVFNPYSVMSVMKSGVIKNYWTMSGPTKILADYLRGSNTDLERMTSEWISAEVMESTYSAENPLSLFFQTGYLTIADWNGDLNYLLRIPNEEVQASLALLLLPEYTGRNSSAIDNDMGNLRLAVNTGDVDGMMNILIAVTASVPFQQIVDRPMESHIHLCVYMMYMMIGATARSEVSTSGGRLDMLVETPWRVYVFEFKIDKSADEALRQIGEKGYALQWEARGRTVTKIGVNFSSKLRCIDDWKAETVNNA